MLWAVFIMGSVVVLWVVFIMGSVVDSVLWVVIVMGSDCYGLCGSVMGSVIMGSVVGTMSKSLSVASVLGFDYRHHHLMWVEFVVRFWFALRVFLHVLWFSFAKHS